MITVGTVFFEGLICMLPELNLFESIFLMKRSLGGLVGRLLSRVVVFDMGCPLGGGEEFCVCFVFS